MLHFGVPGSFTTVWGLHHYPPVLNSASYSIPAQFSYRPATGQRMGGIGHFYTEAGQLVSSSTDGAYILDTYVTRYAFANGQYSFALQVFLTLADQLNLHDSNTTSAKFLTSLADTLNLHDSNAANRITFLSTGDYLNLHDALAANAVMGVTFAESLLLSDVATSNAKMLAYVVNANTSAVTTYSNYNFNSFAKLNGKYYGAAEDGIYELTGSTDNGTAIDASITLGKKDFGSEMMKAVPSVYLGISATGAMVLKTITDTGAVRYYNMTAPANTSAMQTNRLKLGRGVTSRYWQFELQNAAGSDFTLDSMTFHLVVLSRRIMER